MRSDSYPLLAFLLGLVPQPHGKLNFTVEVVIGSHIWGVALHGGHVTAHCGLWLRGVGRERRRIRYAAIISIPCRIVTAVPLHSVLLNLGVRARRMAGERGNHIFPLQVSDMRYLTLLT